LVDGLASALLQCSMSAAQCLSGHAKLPGLPRPAGLDFFD
jgi:hypothetical protein